MVSICFSLLFCCKARWRYGQNCGWGLSDGAMNKFVFKVSNNGADNLVDVFHVTANSKLANRMRMYRK
jgi:hypothetical protein